MSRVLHMRYCEEIKNYLSNKVPDDFSESEAELCGILQSTFISTDEFLTETASAAAARLIFRLIHTVLGFKAALTAKKRSEPGRRSLYAIQIQDSARAKEAIRYFSLDTLSDTSSFASEENSLRAYLRGVFLMRGYCTDPQKGYLIEFTFARDSFAEMFHGILTSLELTFRMRRKNGLCCLYSKNQETYTTFLALIGANEHYLKAQSEISLKEMKNMMQRRVNTETANLNKVVEASLHQTKAIENLIKNDKLSALAPSLAEAAQLRLEYPESSLSEMIEQSGIRISRSALSYRLKKLVEISELD